MDGSKLSQFKTLFVFTCLSIACEVFAQQPVNPWPGQNPPGTTGPQPQTQDSTAPQQPQPQTVPQPSNTQSDQEAQRVMQQMMQYFSSLGQIGRSRPGDSSFDEDLRAGLSQIPGSGRIEPCGSIPSHVQKARDTALAYRERCGYARPPGAKLNIAINDYSGNSMPFMYIFDSSGQNCIGKTAASYGVGRHGLQRPAACNDNGSNYTPPGFFLSSVHNGAAYGPENSVGMIGLEGQGAVGRGVIIHPAYAPGTASSHGCTGVGYDAFNAVKRELGVGSLIYNYFGGANGAPGCRDTRGLGPQHTTCSPDSIEASRLPGVSMGTGSSSTR